MTLADDFRTVAYMATQVAEAILEDDSILGTMASAGFLNAISALPAELRKDIVTVATEEQA